MHIFLRAKHWQLFLLSFGIPMLLQIVMMGSIITGLSPNAGPDFIFSYFKFFPLIMLLFMGTMFGWFWSVATGLQSMVPAGIKMKGTLFKVFLLIPVIYITVLCITLPTLFLSPHFNNVHNPAPILLAFSVIVPLHLFSMFCIFYCMYFAAKTIKTVELQREVTFSDFTGEFFLIWFFCIGIWILQPRINRLVNQQKEEII